MLLVLLGMMVSSLFVSVTLNGPIWFSGTVNVAVSPVRVVSPFVVLAVCVRSVTGSPHVSATFVFIVMSSLGCADCVCGSG